MWRRGGLLHGAATAPASFAEECPKPSEAGLKKIGQEVGQKEFEGLKNKIEHRHTAKIVVPGLASGPIPPPRAPNGLKVLSSRCPPKVLVRGSREPAVDRFQVLHGGRTAEVEEVLPCSAVAGAAALAAADVSEAVFDGHSLAEPSATTRGRDELAEPMLQPLVVCDGDGASCVWGSGGALRAQSAASASSRVEFHVATEIDAFDLARRA